MRLPLRVLAHIRSVARSDLAGTDPTKAVHPDPYAFMGDIEPALVEQVFNYLSETGNRTHVVTAR
ncbi:MAG: hypothetical protein AAGL90_12045 [Pseudomonadota bacterium]